MKATRRKNVPETGAAKSKSEKRSVVQKGDSVPPFPIVAVGASAGGLDAFTELLKHLPGHLDMGFVLVQHLDRHHESMLTQLLTKATPMPVLEVTHNLKVEPNHVYVIPPNTCMTIAKGVLKLHPRKKGPAPHHSIDFFFESLAQDQGTRSIGVVLSGTASDGTVGLEAINAEGGITFAQDHSAQFDSMPRNAVASGCVDFILSPKEIANELAHIATHPYIREPVSHSKQEMVSTPSENEKAPSTASRAIKNSVSNSRSLEEEFDNDKIGYENILRLLRNQCGVDFSLYKPTTILRRIKRRMVLARKDTTEEYGEYLEKNPKELDALYADALINVTSFFRNPEAFDLLRNRVFPDLLQKSGDEPLRVWVLGCSTGQEAYSIAMTFVEAAEKATRTAKLQIFATDLNDVVLDGARRGFYPKTISQEVSPERLRRFFVETDGGYRVTKTLREMVVFARQNLTSDPPFSRMDLISCRNLLIYLEPSFQKKALPLFHYSLKPGGYLFLGGSESISGFANLFEPLDKRHKIFIRKAGPTPAFEPPVRSRHNSRHSPGRKQPSSVPEAKGPEGFRTELNAQREADRIMVDRYAPPSVVVDAELKILQFRGATNDYLELPSGKPTFDLLKMVRKDLLLPLRAAINKARKENKTARRENVPTTQDGGTLRVNIEVIPLKNLRERTFLILFESATTSGSVTTSVAQPFSPPKPAQGADKKEQSLVVQLKRELSETRDYIEALQEQHEVANEELQASNEEVQSTNEELQSINEELETSKEELEATNEELTTINSEMAYRNTELNRLNNDLSNLYVSINTAIVLLGNDLTIRHFTPKAIKSFNLLPSDIGRPLSDIRYNLKLNELPELLAEVIDTVSVREREVQDKDGHWYLLRARPYLTMDKKIDGAVLVLLDIDALKKTQREITAAREYAESIIAIVSPMLILNEELRVTAANETFYSHFRLSPRETENCLVYELDKGQWNIPKLRELLEDVLPQNSRFEGFELTHEFGDLGLRTLRLSGQRVDHLQRILLSIEDITERLQLEGEVRLSERRYRRLFEAAKDGILIVDPHTRKITDANPYIVELLGYPKNRVIGKELWEIGLLQDKETNLRVFQELVEKGFIRYDNLPLKTKTAQVRDVEFVSNLYAEDGEKVIQCNIRDISERKASERELAEKARLLDLSNDAIIVRDFTDRISLWNKGAEKLYGWTCQEVIGKHLHRLLQTEFPKPMEEILAQLQREGSFSGEVVQVARDGRRIPSLCRWVLDRDTGSILTSYTDISKRKEMENELRQAQERLADRANQLEYSVKERTAELTATNKQLEAFVYSIAHDLRAPLRAMQGFSSMLLEEAGETLSETGKGFADRINNSAQYMDALLSDLLSFSSISQQHVQLHPVNLEPVVQSMLSSLQKEIEGKNAHVECMPPWPLIMAHEPTLGQVLTNLVSNALKFIAPEVTPFVRLWAEEHGEFVRIWVEDNGIGVAESHQEQIFRLFTRLHGEKYPGTGIGLAIVQKGIERMGGQIGLESMLSKGSRFWFDLRKA